MAGQVIFTVSRGPYEARLGKANGKYILEIFTPRFHVELTGTTMPDAEEHESIGWDSGSKLNALDDATQALVDAIREALGRVDADPVNVADGGRRKSKRRARKSRRRYT